MKEFREPVFYVPGTTTIIDDAIDRAGVLVGHYSGETLEQIRLRHPGAALGEWDDVYAETGRSCKTEPAEITEDDRSLYRPAGEPINPSEFDVSPINVTEAKPFVCLHHYSSSFPTSRFQFGLFHHG